MAIKRCTAAFAAKVAGIPRMYTPGQLVDDSDPGIKGREALFEDVESYMSNKAARQAPRVEQATAEPGERRSVTPPVAKKPTAKKVASKPEPKPDSKA
jgi:hypothetical protein